MIKRLHTGRQIWPGRKEGEGLTAKGRGGTHLTILIHDQCKHRRLPSYWGCRYCFVHMCLTWTVGDTKQDPLSRHGVSLTSRAARLAMMGLFSWLLTPQTLLLFRLCCWSAPNPHFDRKPQHANIFKAIFYRWEARLPWGGKVSEPQLPGLDLDILTLEPLFLSLGSSLWASSCQGTPWDSTRREMEIQTKEHFWKLWGGASAPEALSPLPASLSVNVPSEAEDSQHKTVLCFQALKPEQKTWSTISFSRQLWASKLKKEVERGNQRTDLELSTFLSGHLRIFRGEKKKHLILLNYKIAQHTPIVYTKKESHYFKKRASL